MESIDAQAHPMKKILIVDDEIPVVSFFKAFFEELGYPVVTTTGSEEARRLLEAEQPFLTLLDIKMETPSSGIDLLRWIKERNFKTKVFMVTSVEDNKALEEAIALGADDYITKPLSLENLQAKVSKLFKALIKDSSE